MKKDKSFSGLPPEAQYFYIKQNVRYNKHNSTNDGEIKMNNKRSGLICTINTGTIKY